MEEHIYPNEETYQRQLKEMGYGIELWQNWGAVPVIDELKPLAREAGLWNLFLPDATRRGPDQRRICHAVRDHGPLADRAGDFQLRRA